MQWRFPIKFGRTDRPAATSDVCDAIEPLLSLYSDGMTSTAETRRVEAHLSECESCRKTHFWIRATYEVISHRAPVLPPPDLASRIQAAIAEADAVGSPIVPIPGVSARPRFNLRPAYAMAAAVAVAAIVVSLSGHRHPNAVAKITPMVTPETSTSSTSPIVTPAPPVIKPTVPSTHAPVTVAVNNHTAAPSKHVPIVAPHEDIDLPPPPVVHTQPRHENLILAVNHPPTTPKAHPAVIRTPVDTHVARVTPSPPPNNEITPGPTVSAPPGPAVVSSAPPERVAIATPVHNETPAPTPVETAPPAPVVVASVEHHSVGLNEALRSMVGSIPQRRVYGSLTHYTVADAHSKSEKDSASWVGGTF